MTDPRKTITEARQRAETATPGPWEPKCIEKEILPNRFALYASAPLPVFVDNPWHWTESRFDQIKKNADFIAHARTDVPALCDIAEAALKENEWQSNHMGKLSADNLKLIEELARYKKALDKAKEQRDVGMEQEVIDQDNKELEAILNPGSVQDE